VEDYGEGLKILDVSKPEKPAQVGEVPRIVCFDAVGSDVYAITPENSMRIYDATNPRLPALRGAVSIPGPLQPTIRATVDWVFASMSNSVFVIDVHDKAAPAVVKTMDMAGFAGQAEVSGNTLYVPQHNGNVHSVAIFNIANPANPTLLTTLTNSSGASSLAVTQNTLYIQSSTAITIWDVTDPSKPSNPQHAPPYFLEDLQRIHLGEDGKLYAIANPHILRLDLTNRFFPSAMSLFALPAMNPFDIYVRDNLAYIGGGDGGLIVGALSDTIPQDASVQIHSEFQQHRVRWLKDFAGHNLISAPTLNGPWSIEQTGYSPTGLFDEALFPSTGTGRFYRLQKPQ
jgi:hypothetical protein